MNRRAPKAALLTTKARVGRADLVRLWVAREQEAGIKGAGDFASQAASLGFAQSFVPPIDRRPDKGEHAEQGRGSEGKPHIQVGPITEVSVSPLPPANFFRVLEREAISSESRHQTARDPEWLANARVLAADGPGRPGARRPLKRPLSPWTRLWPVLRTVLSELVDGVEPDVPRVVERIGSGKCLRRIPMRPRRRWSGEVRILGDFSTRNTPFHRDFTGLTDNLQRLRGKGGLVLEILASDPGEAPWVTRVGRESTPYRWRPPVSSTPLLVLSDLGLYEGGEATYGGWVALGERLCALGLRAAVLCPVPAHKIPGQLRRLFRIYAWDGISALRVLDAGKIARPRSGVFDAAVREEALDLLALIAPALVAEPADVREARRLLPDGHGSVAIEALLYANESAFLTETHEAIAELPARAADRVLSRIIVSSQGLSLDDSEALQVLRRRWVAKADTARRKRAFEMLTRHHAYWPESMRYTEYEEIDRLLTEAGSDPISPGNDWLPAEDRLAFQAWKRDMVATVRGRPDAPELQRWNRESVERQRLDDAAAWANHPERVARWALTQAESSGALQLPAGVQPKDVKPFVDEPPPAFRARVRVRQRGPNIVLVHDPEDETGVSVRRVIKDWDTGLELVAPQWVGGQMAVSVSESEGDGSVDWLVSLRDDPTEFSIRVDRGVRKLILDTGFERVLLDSLSREDLPWTTHLRQDATGLHAFGPEWCGHTIDLIWHPPSGPGSGFWADGYGDTTFGVDDFGLYADLHVGEVRQRCRWILPGTFLMGSPAGEEGRDGNETRHVVTLTRGFWVADTPVTVGLWNEVMGDDSREADDDPRKPVTGVSWDDAQKFLRRLEARVPGLGAGLPTEAQWEYACRAGTQSAYAFGDEVDRSEANIASGGVTPVASYRPNPWGLFDMHGNVWEWCHDWYAPYGSGDRVDPEGPAKGSDRVLRGGSWFNGAVDARSARRRAIDPGIRISGLGFRLAPGRMSGSPAERGGSGSGEPRGTRGSVPADGGGRPPPNPARKPAAKKSAAKKAKRG